MTKANEPTYPPRIRGYYDGDPYMFCPEQWESLPSKMTKSYLEYDFLTLEEHKALVREARASAFEEAAANLFTTGASDEQHDLIDENQKELYALAKQARSVAEE